MCPGTATLLTNAAARRNDRNFLLHCYWDPYFDYQEAPSFCVGLGLGQHVDPSAAMVLKEVVSIPSRETIDITGLHLADQSGWVRPSALAATQRPHFRRVNRGEGRTADPPLAVLLIRRRPLGIKYDRVADDVTSLLTREPLSLYPAQLVVDTGGVGNAIRELLHARGLRHTAV
jgi:hypothetical protein